MKHHTEQRLDGGLDNVAGASEGIIFQPQPQAGDPLNTQFIASFDELKAVLANRNLRGKDLLTAVINAMGPDDDNTLLNQLGATGNISKLRAFAKNGFSPEFIASLITSEGMQFSGVRKLTADRPSLRAQTDFDLLSEIVGRYFTQNAGQLNLNALERLNEAKIEVLDAVRDILVQSLKDGTYSGIEENEPSAKKSLGQSTGEFKRSPIGKIAGFITKSAFIGGVGVLSFGIMHGFLPSSISLAGALGVTGISIIAWYRSWRKKS